MTDAPPPVFRRSRSNRVACGCLLLLLLAVVTPIGLYVSWMPGAHPSLRKVERFSSLTFPPSAVLLDSHGRSYLEIHILAKVEMDPAEVESFIASLPRPLTSSDTDKRKICETRYAVKWWDPDAAHRFRTVEIEKRDSDRAKVWRILIGLDDPQRAVVYLDYCSYRI